MGIACNEQNQQFVLRRVTKELQLDLSPLIYSRHILIPLTKEIICLTKNDERNNASFSTRLTKCETRRQTRKTKGDFLQRYLHAKLSLLITAILIILKYIKPA